jgi:hypothetical protein
VFCPLNSRECLVVVVLIYTEECSKPFHVYSVLSSIFEVPHKFRIVSPFDNCNLCSLFYV